MITLKEKKISNDPIFNNKYDLYYDLYHENTLVGEAQIKSSGTNMVYINIYEKYQGNNYGKETFETLLQVFRSMNINKIHVIIDNDNIRMIRIISHYKNMILENYKDFKKYEVCI